MLYDFNIRDTIVFTLNPIFFKSEKLNEKQHFLVVTWFNNGLLFFKSINMINHAIENKSETIWKHSDFDNPLVKFYKKWEEWNLNYYWNNDLEKSQGKPSCK